MEGRHPQNPVWFLGLGSKHIVVRKKIKKTVIFIDSITQDPTWFRCSLCSSMLDDWGQQDTVDTNITARQIFGFGHIGQLPSRCPTDKILIWLPIFQDFGHQPVLFLVVCAPHGSECNFKTSVPAGPKWLPSDCWFQHVPSIPHLVLKKHWATQSWTFGF